jgi:hypothetical protein
MRTASGLRTSSNMKKAIEDAITAIGKNRTDGKH